MELLHRVALESARDLAGYGLISREALAQIERQAQRRPNEKGSASRSPKQAA